MVQKQFGEDVIEVDLFLDYSPSKSLSFLHYPGSLVTAVYIEPGQSIETGNKVIQIDGIDRLAISSPQPFWRLLSVGDQGTDVVMLKQLLAEFGYNVQSDINHLSEADLLAIQTLAGSLGVASLSEVEHFDPSWFIWLGSKSDPFVVWEVLITTGQLAPSVGVPIANERVRLQAVETRNMDSSTIGSRVTLMNYNLEVLGSSHPFRNQTDDQNMILWLESLLVENEISTDEVVIPAVLRSTPDSQQLVVPASSIIVDSQGNTCVLLANENATPIAVDIRDTSFDGVFVEGIEEGTEILLAPVIELESCYVDN